MQLGRFRPTVGNGDSDQDFLGRFLGILHVNVKIAVVVKNTRIYELVLRLVAGPLTVGLYQIRVRIRFLRIFVEPFHVGMRWRRIEIEIILLNVLAVVTLAVSESKEPFFENRISPVPQREREAQLLILVGETRQSVLAPMVGTRSRLVMGEVAPRVAIFAVILPYSPPLALGQIGSPLP